MQITLLIKIAQYNNMFNSWLTIINYLQTVYSAYVKLTLDDKRHSRRYLLRMQITQQQVWAIKNINYSLRETYFVQTHTYNLNLHGIWKWNKIRNAWTRQRNDYTCLIDDVLFTRRSCRLNTSTKCFQSC